MSPFQAQKQDLPEVFPVFPLGGALLLPRGRLPLNIFEPRYLALIEDALAGGRLFGMIQPDTTRPAGRTGPALFRVGCLGRIVAFSETDDGRYLVTLAGISRFRLVAECTMQRGHRRVEADFAPFGADLADPTGSLADRAELLIALRAYFTRRGFDANWEAIEKMSDQELVVTLCMVCPFDPPEKQALLEAATEADRAATLLALLRIDLHEPPTADDAPPRGRAS